MGSVSRGVQLLGKNKTKTWCAVVQSYSNLVKARSKASSAMILSILHICCHPVYVRQRKVSSIFPFYYISIQIHIITKSISMDISLITLQNVSFSTVQESTVISYLGLQDRWECALVKLTTSLLNTHKKQLICCQPLGLNSSL